jgi:mannose-6-phosphate isomerase
LAGNALLCLRRHEPKPGECYFLPAGTVHALGGGLVVLEVQQTSDATFRLYDWGRLDESGQPRPLHLEAGLASLKENPPGAGLQKPSQHPWGEQLVVCDYFEFNRLSLTDAMHVAGPVILVGLAGEAVIGEASSPVRLHRGGCALIPASLDRCPVLPQGGCALAQITIRRASEDQPDL